MSKPLLNLCSVPKVLTRDGYAGSNAKVLLPFYGYWMANGATITFSRSQIVQDISQTVRGTQMSDTFQKSCCDTCLGH